MNTNHIPSETPTNQIDLSLIQPSPFNYRWGKNQVITDESLQELKESIIAHEVIQAVLVRPIENKFELVVGERRYRASLLAGKTTIPATIRTLTDEQVQEIQLIENLQREDPNPLAEAKAIARLLSLKDKKNTVANIAATLGKSQAYIYQRIKLNDLCENLKMVVLADKISISDALKLARLHPDLQEEFYTDNCEDWEEENWELDDIDYSLRRIMMNLNNAPFDINDKKLDKKAGACCSCPFNTAFTASLFPADDDSARCTNKGCFDNKSLLTEAKTIAAIIKKHPDLIVAFDDKDEAEQIIECSPLTFAKKVIAYRGEDFTSYKTTPAIPVKEDFEYNDEEEDNENDFKEAVAEYDEELKQFNIDIADTTFQKAILANGRNAGTIVYITKKPVSNSSSYSSNRSSFKAADFAQAQKEKTLSPEIIESERQRLFERERRCEELDVEKLHTAIFEATQEDERSKKYGFPFGANDRAVGNFLLFDMLSYSDRNLFSEQAFGKCYSDLETSDILNFCFNAKEEQLSFLLRRIMLSKSDAKFPNGNMGILFRKMAEGTPSIDIDTLILKQNDQIKERKEKLEEKLQNLDKQLLKLQSTPV